MLCSICQEQIKDNNFSYQNIEGKLYYYHIPCQDVVDDIIDEIDDDEQSFVAFVDEELQADDEEDGE